MLGKDRDLSKTGILSNEASCFGPLAHATVGFTKLLTILAETESPVIAFTACNGLMTIERLQMDKLTNRALPAYALYEI